MIELEIVREYTQKKNSSRFKEYDLGVDKLLKEEKITLEEAQDFSPMRQEMVITMFQLVYHLFTGP